MDELEKKAEETLEARKDEPSPKDTDEGIQSETDEKVKQLNADTERIKKAIAENENAKAKQSLAGKAEAGLIPKTQEETDQKEADGRVEAFR